MSDAAGGEVIDIREWAQRHRRTMTAETAVYHALRVYGPLCLAELVVALEEIARSEPVYSTSRTPKLTRGQVQRALRGISSIGFVEYSQSARLWMVIDAAWEWENTYQ